MESITSKDRIRSEFNRTLVELGLTNHEERCAIVAASLGVAESTVHEVIAEQTQGEPECSGN